MILLYGSQQDHDAMAGQSTDKPAWSGEDLAAMGQFMQDWTDEMVASGEFVDAKGLAAPVHTRRVATDERRGSGHRRAVRGNPGGARWLHHRRVRELRQGNGNRRAGWRRARPVPEVARGRMPTSGRSTRAFPRATRCREPERRDDEQDRRGRGAGVADCRRQAVGNGTDPRQPARMADHRRSPPSHRSAPRRPGTSPPRGHRCS